MICAVAIMLVSLVSPQPGDDSWYTHYERGVELVEAGDGAAAVVELEHALEARPEPALRVATDGPRYIDYLPNLFLAIALHMGGDVDRAKQHLTAAEAAGVAAQSEFGSRLLGAYQLLLGRPAVDIAPEVPAGLAAGYRNFDRKQEVLSEEEFDRVRRGVLNQCALPPHTRDENAPWYFHYEMGVTLVDKGDPQRALDALISATDRRPVSQRNARMYGMWFTNYRPYLEIAQAHVQLGNWSCAFDALSLSRQLDEVEEEEKDFERFMELTEETAEHLE
jgi:hypothetical protein